MNYWVRTVKRTMRPTKWFSITHSPVWMVLLGLVARVLYIVIAHLYRFDAAHWHVFEMANLGYSLATGRGFSSPFGVTRALPPVPLHSIRG